MQGTFFDGQTSRARACDARLDGDKLIITHADGVVEYPVSQAVAPPAPTPEVFFLEFPDGAKLEGIGILPGFDRDPQRPLEKYWRQFAAGVALIGVAGILFFWKGIPALAESWAPLLPKSATNEATAGLEKIMGPFDEMYRSHSPLVVNTIEELRASNPELDIKIKLCCENSPANAFALPDGHIILVRKMLKLLTPEQQLAVVLHEVGHLRHYHPQRAFIENRFMTGALLVTAGFGEAFGWGLTIINASHSREQEKEADLFAAQELLKRGKSPLLLAEALEAMDREAKSSPRKTGWLFSHPITPERREYLEASVPEGFSTKDESEVEQLPESEE